MSETLTTWFHYLVDNPSTATLLIGGVLFGIVFLIFQLTKWGHENPVSKCVALSVFAHVILLTYAYTTNLVTHIPVVLAPPPVPIRLADVPMEQEVSEAADGQEAPFWNSFRDQAPNEVLQNTELEALDASVDIGANLSDEDLTPDNLDTDLQDWKQEDSFSNTTNSMDSQLEADQPLETALQESLTPRPTQSEALPSFEVSDASQQELAAGQSTNPLRDPLANRQPEDRQQQEDQWLADQMSVDGPQRMDSGQDELQIQDVQSPPNMEVADTQFQNRQSRDRVDQMVHDAASASAAMSQIVPASNAHSPQVNLPRAAVDATQLAEGKRRLGDGKPLPSRYQRRHSRPLPWLKEQGGTEETEAAIARALAYLAANQQADGSWNPRLTDAGRELQVLGHNRQGAGARADTGITGLAILAFLGAGNSHLEGPYRQNVQKGLEYLISRQQKNGSLAGSAQFFAQMYCHSMALLAVSEAYSVSGDARLAAAVQRGVGFSIQAQNQTVGGWRYQPGDSGDMSQFGWQVLALSSAQLGGQKIPTQTNRLMESFLKKHTSGRFGGLAFYRYGENVNPAMTAEAMLCRYLLNQPISAQTSGEAANEILGPIDSSGSYQHLPGNEVDNIYFWYYATLAMHQMAVDPINKNNRAVQEGWDQWNQQLKNRLLALQESSGADVGSWDSKKFMWGCYGGRVYSTAMAAMCLQVYYRYDLVAEEQMHTANVPELNSGQPNARR